MAKNLVIVESPTKAKTISRFLGSDYDVQASFGHVRDLPKSKMGIDTDHDFEPTYTIPVKAKKVVADLKARASKANEVILATDEDREGEAIAWHLVSALKLKEDDTKRIVFHEITKPAIAEALEHPRHLDLNLVDAQQARRILDRLVGYELSPFIWKKVRYGLSAGRVQSVALRLIVEREREIQKFVKQEYWSIDAAFEKEKIVFGAKLNKIGGKTLGKMDLSGEGGAQKIVDDLAGAKYNVAEITTKQTSRNPAAPFTTSTLQQEAARKFGMSAKQTMVIAQQLYEGMDIGEEGSTGLITYMRTDSVNLSELALKQAAEIISERFGKEYYNGSPRRYSTKSKNAQEAHEAIRPTDLSRHPENVKQYLDRGQQKIYELIWKRTIASQMAQAIFDSTAVDIEAGGRSGENYTLRANGQVVKFEGFIKAYTEGIDEDQKEQNEIEGQLPQLDKGEALKLSELKPNQHFTEPPARYTDATLIKALESFGIGRPSTYAPTLSTIQDRDYVEKTDKKYAPTEIGFLVNDLLVANFPEVIDINFTAKMEEELDQIAEGKIKWQPVIKEFYGPFKQHVVTKTEEVEKQVEVSDTPCPHCGKPMIIKYGRFGKFLACPEGEKITKPMPEEEAKIKALEEKTKDERCPVCGSPMKVQRGRFGFFLGCSRYPECKGIMKIQNKIGFKCPACGIGDVVEKKARGRGQPFYACSRYPDCEFAINKKPATEEELKALWEEAKNKPRKKKYYKKSSK
ncbi:type I DNA topoisomerase [Patescibacteria group bacterium]|nr:type I DNA topoisomerase [Patescibacteria group bacterium]